MPDRSCHLALPSKGLTLCAGSLCAVLPLLAGCSEPDPPPPPPPEIVFAEVGSLSTPTGEGSFRFGAASAATQIEDDNPHTDWYVATQAKSEGGLGLGIDFVGDASMGYSKAIEDVALLSEMQLDAYRFSIEWARVEPERDTIDEAALEHYGAFIDALLAAGIRPMITLHHFSNPRWVDDPLDVDCKNGPSDANLCGFDHPEGAPQIIEEMAEHAALLAERFGDRVDDWCTVNEPINYLLASYGIGYFPPGKKSVFSLLEKFMPVLRNFALGHAAMYRAIKDNDSSDADGNGEATSVGLTLSVGAWEAARDNEPSDLPEDVTARDRFVYLFHYLLIDSIRAG